MIEIIVIASFFIIIAALLYLIYLGNKNNPMSISAAEDIKKMNEDLKNFEWKSESHIQRAETPGIHQNPPSTKEKNT